MLVESGATGLVVAAANRPARALGVREGLRFTDARARIPDLRHGEINRQADQASLRALGHWMVRWSPYVAVDGRQGLLLDTTGCDHLHGGEAAMMARLSGRLKESGLCHLMGLAGTPGAAMALAAAADGTILPPGTERDGLADLPVSALGLSGEAEELLRRFGLIRIGQLYDIDRAALARRFHAREAVDAVRLRLDQVLGLRRQPVRWLAAPAAFSARLPCPEPIASSDGITAGLDRLLADVGGQLSRAGQGGRRFVLRAFRTDNTVVAVALSAARPVRDPGHLLRLFRERIDRIDPGFGIDLLQLDAHRPGPMAARDAALDPAFAGREEDLAALSRLADRVGARLGEGRVTVAGFTQSYLPERAERRAPFDGELPHPIAPPVPAAARPVRLFDPPEALRVMAEVPEGPPLHFVWRRVPRKVTRADGPERIAPEWWRRDDPAPRTSSPEGAAQRWLVPKLDPRADASLIVAARERAAKVSTTAIPAEGPRTRDYYRIEDDRGRRYWVFREGLYGDENTRPPQWFMHGLFS